MILERLNRRPKRQTKRSSPWPFSFLSLMMSGLTMDPMPPRFQARRGFAPFWGAALPGRDEIPAVAAAQSFCESIHPATVLLGFLWFRFIHAQHRGMFVVCWDRFDADWPNKILETS